MMLLPKPHVPNSTDAFSKAKGGVYLRQTHEKVNESTFQSVLLVPLQLHCSSTFAQILINRRCHDMKRRIGNLVRYVRVVCCMSNKNLISNTCRARIQLAALHSQRR